MASIWIHTVTFQPSAQILKRRKASSHVLELRNGFQFNFGGWNVFQHSSILRVVDSSVGCKRTEEDDVIGNKKSSIGSNFQIGRLQETISSLPPIVLAMKRRTGTNFALWLGIAMAILIISVRAYVARKSRHSRPGSVADLVRRGQLRSDRRGISRPLKYEDPFNNPLVKVGKQNSTVQMCGKVYRLAPVTLTNEQQAIHQKRRSRAYQWKRPTIFLKEGDSIPPDVDPDTIRWIPTNHPFATTAADIDEDLAQNNVYQKRGVPFRIRAEHEALQKKLEGLQKEQKLNDLSIDPSSTKDFERSFKSNSKIHDSVEEIPSDNQAGNPRPPQSDTSYNSFGSNFNSEEAQQS